MRHVIISTTRFNKQVIVWKNKTFYLISLVFLTKQLIKNEFALVLFTKFNYTVFVYFSILYSKKQACFSKICVKKITRISNIFKLRKNTFSILFKFSQNFLKLEYYFNFLYKQNICLKISGLGQNIKLTNRRLNNQEDFCKLSPQGLDIIFRLFFCRLMN